MIKSESFPISIRPMVLGDIEAVTKIDELSFALPWPKNAYTFELLENSSAVLWVAETQPGINPAQVIGLIAIWLILDEAHISTLATHPDYRGQGVAIRLIKTALGYAISQGAKTATLEVRESNQIAQSLYRKFGFQVVGRRVKYYRDNSEDAILMTLANLESLSKNYPGQNVVYNDEIRASPNFT